MAKIKKIKSKTTKIKNIKEVRPVNKKSYTLKPPLKVKCMRCENDLTVLFCPPRQDYSKKNNLGYWSGQEQYQGKYECDNCLVDRYRNRKLEYLEIITDSKKRRLFRVYYATKNPLSSPSLN